MNKPTELGEITIRRCIISGIWGAFVIKATRGIATNNTYATWAIIVSLCALPWVIFIIIDQNRAQRLATFDEFAGAAFIGSLLTVLFAGGITILVGLAMMLFR